MSERCITILHVRLDVRRSRRYGFLQSLKSNLEFSISLSSCASASDSMIKLSMQYAYLVSHEQRPSFLGDIDRGIDIQRRATPRTGLAIPCCMQPQTYRCCRRPCDSCCSVFIDSSAARSHAPAAMGALCLQKSLDETFRLGSVQFPILLNDYWSPGRDRL